MATKSNHPTADVTEAAQAAPSAQLTDPGAIRDSVDALRTAGLTIYEYLLFGHDSGDAEGYAAAMTAYARHHARLVRAGYEPATLFALCAERVISQARELALLRIEQSSRLYDAVHVVPVEVLP